MTKAQKWTNNLEQGNFRQKKMDEVKLHPFPCGRGDSNSHALTSTTTSTLLVYQFQHRRNPLKDCKCKSNFNKVKSKLVTASELS